MLKKLMVTVLLATACTAHAAPMFNIFELGIQPGQSAAYDEAGRNNITASVQHEPGTLAMYSVRQTNNPSMAYMLEIYADTATYQEHIQSPQYREFLRRSPEILTEHKRKTEVVPQFLGDKKVQQTPATINNLVIVDVKPEHAQAFRAIVVPEMEQSLKVESGVWAMYAATGKTNPNRWYFYEIYADKTAYEQHRQTPHFQDYLKRTADMLQGKESIAITPALLMNKGGLHFDAAQ